MFWYSPAPPPPTLYPLFCFLPTFPSQLNVLLLKTLGAHLALLACEWGLDHLLGHGQTLQRHIPEGNGISPLQQPSVANNASDRGGSSWQGSPPHSGLGFGRDWSSTGLTHGAKAAVSSLCNCPDTSSKHHFAAGNHHLSFFNHLSSFLPDAAWPLETRRVIQISHLELSSPS